MSAHASTKSLDLPPAAGDWLADLPARLAALYGRSARRNIHAGETDEARETAQTAAHWARLARGEARATVHRSEPRRRKERKLERYEQD